MLLEATDELQLSSLKTSQELLKKRKETIHQLDIQILDNTEDANTLEDLILEIEETQDTILEKINQIETFIGIRARAPPIRTPPSSAIPPQSTLANTESTIQSHSHAPDSTATTTANTESTIQSHSHAPDSTATTTANTETTTIKSTTTVTAHDTLPIVTPVVPPILPPTSGLETTGITNSYSQATSRLPKLTLPIFTGDPLSWQIFWDSFSAAVDSSPTLGAIQKFNYLRPQLQGDAARTIAGLPLTEAIYSQ